MEHPPYFRVRLSKFLLMSGLPTESPATCAPRPSRLSPFPAIMLILCTMITNTLSLIHLTRGAQYIAAIKGRGCLISGPTGGGYRTGGFLAKSRKYRQKAQCTKNVANLSLDRGLGGAQLCTQRWLRHRAEHKAKESPTSLLLTPSA